MRSARVAKRRHRRRRRRLGELGRLEQREQRRDRVERVERNEQRPAGSPGFYPGTVQAFPDLGTSLQALAITPFVLDSAVLSGDVSFDGGAGVVTIPAEADGGVGAVALGALTLPGSDDGGAPNLLPYPGAHPQPGASSFVSGDLLALPLSEILTMSRWSASTSAAPASFANGQTYTVILLGNDDPNVTQLIDPDLDLDPTTYDGRGMHLVAFPNRFTPIPLP